MTADGDTQLQSPGKALTTGQPLTQGAIKDLRVVLNLARVVDDVDPTELRALIGLACSVDYRVNRQAASNPHVAATINAHGVDWFTDLEHPCSYPYHDVIARKQECVCRGQRTAIPPTIGDVLRWSTIGIEISQQYFDVMRDSKWKSFIGACSMIDATSSSNDSLRLVKEP